MSHLKAMLEGSSRPSTNQTAAGTIRTTKHAEGLLEEKFFLFAKKESTYTRIAG